MTRIARPLTLIASLIVATSGLAACSSSGPNATNASSPTGSGVPSASDLIANLPDLGLKNVKTETAAARGAVITPAGGTITATGSNGTIYTLTIPRDAVPSTTQIAIYPLSSVANLPGGVTVSAGVQITPDGLELRRPATLTIQFPTGIETQALGGLGWTGDAEKVQPHPASIQGQTVTMQLFHFCGRAVTPTPLPFGNGASCTDEDEMDTVVGSAMTVTNPSLRRDFLANTLRTCYRDYVAPELNDAMANLLDIGWQNDAYQVYEQWRYALADAASAVGSQAFTVSPEAAEAKAAALALVQAWYEAENQDCIAHKNDPTSDGSIEAAGQAMSSGWQNAHDWGFDTAANGLDLETALDRLCVQVVIDPSRNYDATGPGKTGAVTVQVGITIAGGQLRPARAQVTLTRTGTGAALAQGPTDAQGNYSAEVLWPTGVDPMEIDILAELILPGFQTFTGLVARFDRITQASGMVIHITAPTGVWSREHWPVVMPTCQELFMAADDATDFTFSLSGPATVTKRNGDHIYFRGTDDGVVAFTAHSPTLGAGTYSAYLSVLAGLFHDVSDTTIVHVDGHLDQEGALSYDVRQLVGNTQTDDWTYITAKEHQLSGTDQLGNAMDLTLSGDQLIGTIAGRAVMLQRDCG